MIAEKLLTPRGHWNSWPEVTRRANAERAAEERIAKAIFLLLEAQELLNSSGHRYHPHKCNGAKVGVQISELEKLI